MDEFRRRPTAWTNQHRVQRPIDAVSTSHSPQNAQPATVQANRPIEKTPALPAQAAPRRKSRRRLIVAAIIGCLLIIGGVSGFLLWPRQPHFPASLISSTEFPLYYPVTLPPGYSVDKNSVNQQTSSSLIYVIVRNGDRAISISEQAKPPQSQIVETAFAKNLSGSSLISTPYGTATIGIFSGRISASLMTDKTWILLSAIAPVSSDEVATTLKGLQLSH